MSPIADPSPFHASANGHACEAAPEFDDAFRKRLRQLVAWRRDVRRFRSDPLPAGALERLIETACLAP
jgi:hypothetical protein